MISLWFCNDSARDTIIYIDSRRCALGTSIAVLRNNTGLNISFTDI